MLTLRLLLAARDGRDEALADALETEARRASDRLGPGSRAIVLTRVASDRFAELYRGARAFEAVLAVDPPAGADQADRLVDVVRGAGQRLGGEIQADVSGALIAQRRHVVGSEGPVRFLYLMRHRAGLTTERFQEHWGGPHAEFGRRTPGLRGYDQLHVIPSAARAAARIAGVGIHQIDGVPELHLESVEEFISKAFGSEAGIAALEDEKSFVDARNSVGFACRERVRYERSES